MVHKFSAGESQGDIMTRLRIMERQIQELAASRRLEAASIGAGGITIAGGALRFLDVNGKMIIELGKTSDGRYGLRVNDTLGAPQVRIGELASGGYGLEAVNAADELVTIERLAFGLRAATQSGSTTVTSTSYADPPDGLGPTLTGIQIGSSHRALVIVGAVFGSFTSTPYAYAGFRVEREDTSTQTLPGSDDKAFQGAVYEARYGGVQAALIDGSFLPVTGSYTFEAQYRVSTGTAVASARSLIVMPF